MAKISIIVGKDEDLQYFEEAKKILEDFGIDYKLKTITGLDSLEPVYNFINEVENEKIEVIIVCSSIFFHLAGIIASKTFIPVIVIPFPSNDISTNDLIFSSVQMPEGVPVACMSIGKAGIKNAIIFALEVLSIKYETLKNKLKELKSQYV